MVGSLLLLSGCVHRYRAQGVVLAVDRAGPTLTVSHRAIPRYMEAMVMPFPVDTPRELDGLTPGARIDFQLRVTRHASSIRHIRVAEAGLADVPLPKAEGKVAICELVPDFTLTAQDGRPLRLSSLRGQLVVVDFIYTRCPLPDVCPRLSANFARLQRRFGGKIALLSITLDPDYDTPQVLSDYAQRWRADPSTWSFLTGPPDDVHRVAGRFGVIYWAEEGAITHTSSTAILDRTGRLVAVVQGSSFTSQQLIDLVGQMAGSP